MRLLLLFLTFTLAALSAPGKFPENFRAPLERIAFGSCNRHDLPQPLWSVIAGNRPDLFIWLGDNIYGDSEDMAVLKAKYDAQRAVPAYADFSRQTAILATWDDHDYGANNADASYAQKVPSQQLALDFADVPGDDPRRKREGLYGSYTFGPTGQQVKILLIDNRYHSDAWGEGEDMLGPEQMRWLKQELRTSEAQLNLIASGTQVLPVDQPYEKWANFPATRDALLQFIKDEDIPGVIFLSGDRHIHEINLKNDDETDYPLIEVTSSGLTHAWRNFPGEPNRFRFGPVFDDLGFGLIMIDWEAQPASITLQIRDRDNTVTNSMTLPIMVLRPQAEGK